MTKSINLDRQCIVCGSTKLSKVSLGNYFLSQYFTPSKPQPSHNLNHFSYTLAQCSDCHHIQNTNLHPSLTNITTSDFKKLDFELRAKSVEPEDHFDPLLVWLSQFVDFNKSLRSIGTTYKDITLIQKINQLILGNNLPVKVDLLSSHDDTLEFTYELLKSNYNLTRLSGKYDFIAARHILEHVPNPLQFIRRMLGHINDKGILYLELPSPKYLANHGYAAQAWEEHCSYFTTQSLLKMASQMQLQCEIVFFENGCEPLLCAVLKKSNNLKSNL